MGPGESFYSPRSGGRRKRRPPSGSRLGLGPRQSQPPVASRPSRARQLGETRRGEARRNKGPVGAATVGSIGKLGRARAVAELELAARVGQIQFALARPRGPSGSCRMSQPTFGPARSAVPGGPLVDAAGETSNVARQPAPI